MTEKILIMGLPGAGKTYFAQRLKQYLELTGNRIDFIKSRKLSLVNFPDRIPTLDWDRLTVKWFNADDVRKKFNDWDFSREGRIRQSLRMAEFALNCSTDFVICDFVAPLEEMRENFSADWTIWMDTIETSRFDDTNKAFIKPRIYNFRITEQNAEKWVPFVAEYILNNKKRPKFDWKKETVQLLGRWQPWHAGHRALFDEAIKKTGQVCVMIRDCNGWQNSNPFEANQVIKLIEKDLDPLYQGQYTIQVVPNITEIAYGRDVGYKINQIELDADIQKISGTKIREEMKEKGLL